MTVSLDEMSPVLLSPVFIQNDCAWDFHRGYELLRDFFDIIACQLLHNGIQQCSLLFFPTQSKTNSLSNPIPILLATCVLFSWSGSKCTVTHQTPNKNEFSNSICLNTDLRLSHKQLKTKTQILALKKEETCTSQFCKYILILQSNITLVLVITW